MGETDRKSEENEETENKTDDTLGTGEKIWELDWMLRPCQIYKSEFQGCKSFRGRFNQLFVYGEQLDCTQWKKDFENCKKWKNSDDEQAYNDLLASEKKRRLDRLRPHVTNDVWTRRDSPPADWDAPLPEWMVDRDSRTFLAAKQKEILDGKHKELLRYPHNFCTIL